MQLLGKAYLFALFLSTFVSYTFAQNEFAEEASQKQVTYKFSVTAKPGTAFFELHGAAGSEIQLKRVQEILEKNSVAIFNYFNYVPVNTIHMRINNAAMRANGSAQAVPRNLVVLNMFPPVGSSHLLGHDDWYKGLVLHELVHIVHLEQANGFLYVLTLLMGNAGRLGGLVPRWFTEGVATWAETHFTKGGRLRQQQLLAEAKAFLQRNNFCQTIDCLDNPGEYPFASMSYWVGAAFMDYLEKKRPGTISCIVNINSYRVPFFFRGAWSQCIQANETVESLFVKFRSSFLDREERTHKYARAEEIDPYRTGEIVWSRDFQVVNNDLYWVQRYKDSSRLVRYNLETKNRDVTYVDYYIDQLQKNSKGLYTTTSRFRRNWIQKYIRQNQKVVGRGDFLVSTKKGNYQWRYVDKKWKLFNEKEQVQSVLPELSDIVDAFDDQLIVRKKDQYFLKRGSRWLSLPGSSRLLGVCREQGAKQVVLKGENSLVVVKGDRLYINKSSWAQDVIKARFNKDHAIFQLNSNPTKLHYSNKGCGDLVKTIVNQSKVRESKPAQKTKLGTVPVKEFAHIEKSYPRLSHFKPNIWLLGYTNSSTYNRFDISTTVNDPLNRHQLSLTYSMYNRFDNVLSGSYTYNWSGTLLSAFSESDYTSNYGRYDKEVTEGLSISRSFFFDRYAYNVSLSADRYTEDDVVSRRKGESYSVLQQLSASRLFMDSFMRSTVVTSLTRFHEVNGINFREQDFKFQTKLQPATRLFTIFQGSYGKLDKKDLVSGALFSGNYESQRLHEFIGLGTKSSFGNEVVTGRFMIDWEMTRIHRGWGFAPVMLRTLNFLGGTDYLKTDYIYVRSLTYLRNSYAQSYYGGLRTKWTIGYFLPVRLDILKARVKREGYSIDEDTTEFFAGADLTF